MKRNFAKRSKKWKGANSVMQTAIAIRDREEILSAWENVWDEYTGGPRLDVARFKHLIFDSWQYFRRFKAYNSVLREDLPIVRYISSFWMNAEQYPANCEQYMYECCTDFAQGLTWAIENDFERGRHKESLPLLLSWHDHGGADTEADMSAYDSYARDFRKHMIYFMREQAECDDEIEENEELKKITELMKEQK